jgi:hypothetical protein
VEVDETYAGGEEEGVRGRQTLRKAIVAIAVEVHDPKGFGRLRMQRIPDVSSVSLTGFVLGAVQPGAVVRTDGWNGYNDLAPAGYIRNGTVLAATGDPLAAWDAPGCGEARASGRLPRRIHLSVQPVFCRLLENAVRVEPVPYGSIVSGGPGARRSR